MKRSFTIYHLPLIMGLCLLAMTASASVPVRIITTDDRRIEGTATWQAVQRHYLVEVQNPVPATLTVLPRDIKTLQARPPQGWDPQTRTFNPALTAAQMEAIIREYIMLEFDIPAATHLMRMYQRDRKFEDIMRISGLISAGKPEARTTLDTAPFIWEAMIALKRTAELNNFLVQGSASPNREVAAMAAIRRGDLLVAEGRPRDALKDGFLRAATLFRDVKTVQPEALYKSALAFDELKQVHYATKMRQTLLSSFGTSDWARRAGGQ